MKSMCKSQLREIIKWVNQGAEQNKQGGPRLLEFPCCRSCIIGHFALTSPMPVCFHSLCAQLLNQNKEIKTQHIYSLITSDPLKKKSFLSQKQAHPSTTSCPISYSGPHFSKMAHTEGPKDS